MLDHLSDEQVLDAIRKGCWRCHVADDDPRQRRAGR
jgi:hypothetical protein